MFSIEVHYPDRDGEIEIVRTTTAPQDIELKPVCAAADIRMFRDLIWRVPAAQSVIAAAVNLVRATRSSEAECPEEVKRHITWGAGPRASQYLVLAAKAYALLDKRPTPSVEDIRRAALPVLRHRLVRSFHAEVESISTNDIIKMLLDQALKE